MNVTLPENSEAQKFIIDPSDYQINGLIGNGSFGSVYLVQHKSTHKMYSMKVVKCHILNQQQQQYLIREIETMATAIFPSLLSLRGFSLPSGNDTTATLITDYMANKSLHDMLVSERNSEAPPQWNATTKYITILGVAAGMRHLHSLSIMHRDLKPENILLDDNFEPHIGDFGLAKHFILGDAKTNTGKLGTPLYMAPELFSDQPYDLTVDVYAFGMIVYEILSGFVPFQEISNPWALGMKICNSERPKMTPSIPNNLRSLIEKCWSQIASSRPPFTDIVNYLLNKSVIPDDCDSKLIEAYYAKITSSNVQLSENEATISLQAEINQQNENILAIQNSLSSFFTNSQKQLAAMQEEIDRIKQNNISMFNEFRNTFKRQHDILLNIVRENTQISNEIISLKNMGYKADITSQSSGEHLSLHMTHIGPNVTLSNSNSSLVDQNTGQLSLNKAVSPSVPVFNFSYPSQQPPSTSPVSPRSKPVFLPQIPTSPRAQEIKHDPPNENHPDSIGEQKDLEKPKESHVSGLFNGIIAKLTKDNGGVNLCSSGIVKITGTSYNEFEDAKLKNILDFGWNDSWSSALNDSSYIIFDFIRQTINVRAYALKTYNCSKGMLHLRSWALEGSNDTKTWAELDLETDNFDLNSPNAEHLFNCKRPLLFFRYIRLRQTGPSHRGAGNGFSLTNIEFFGQLRNS